MHLVRMCFGGVPPFTDPVAFKFDEQVNVFIGPNASGKSTVLQMLTDLLIGPDGNSKRPISHPRRLIYCPDGEFDELVQLGMRDGLPNVLSASEDWLGTTHEPKTPGGDPCVVEIGAFRAGLPGVSGLEDCNGETAAEILKGPFSGLSLQCASDALAEELWPVGATEDLINARGRVMRATKLADSCSKVICDEVIRDSETHNYIPGPDIRGYLQHPHADLDNIRVLRGLGIDTNDPRNFENLSMWEEPSYSAYHEDADSVPIYLGHLSSGTEGTLLWIRWLALKMVVHYEFEEGWEKKPAILLIDEIENHLHPRGSGGSYRHC